jgi:glycosyltransferase involved in cell wall biosynthesis
VALLHKYPPVHGAGAEWMAHSLFRALAARGHHVTVLVPGVEPLDFDGVKVRRPDPAVFAGADVLVTHLDLTRRAVDEARRVACPVVHLVHNHRQFTHHGVMPEDADLVVVNSEWIRRRFSHWPGPLEVIHPPVDVDDYDVPQHTEDRVTLVNLAWAPEKGGRLFWDLAAALPHRQFLGVRGAYGRQAEGDLGNVVVLDNGPDMANRVYARTKLLLMPSGYESWGRCAIEAACSGIPTVANPTEGLVEALGGAAVWRTLDDFDGWVEAIEHLYDDDEMYGDYSARAFARARELDPRLGDYDRWERLIVDVARGKVRAEPR